MAYKKVKLWVKEKAAIYIRVSTAYQIDKDSLPMQRKMCIAYCELHGLDYIVFEDAGVSAKSEKRPAYQDMMQRFREGEFSHLIVYKLDRISRNLIDFMGMYEELENLYVTFISLNENFDTNTAMGKAMLAIMIVFAQMEREIDSERVLSVMISRAENTRPEVNEGHGLWNGAQTPYGFIFNDEIKYPVPDENGELPYLHLIYDMYEEVQSTKAISRYFNRNNIPSKRGGKWTSKVIADIIKNRFNIGEYSYNKRESGRGPYKPVEEWVIRPNNHPAVIDIDQFNRCNKILESNRKTAKKRNIKHVHIFRGILKCHKCGSSTSCSKDKRRLNGISPSVYSCSLRQSDLDDGCSNSSNVSDYVVGNFVIPFIINYYRVYKNFKLIAKAKDPIETLEKQLLKGSKFHGTSIEESSLTNIYNVLMKSSDLRNKTYYPITDNADETRYKAKIEIENMQKELEKCNVALQRLTELYLFNEEAMSKKEYLSKKKELELKVDSIKKEINNHSNAQYYDSFHDYFNKNKENLREHMKNYLACVPLLIYFLAIAYMIL